MINGDYDMKKEKLDPRNNLIVRILAVSLASLIMALNINTFVHTGGLLPGGASGLTLLLQEVFQKFLGITIPYTPINILINAFPVYIGFRFIGKKFTFLSCWMIVLTGILTDVLPSYVITQDTLLISIFGGIINGFAICLCLFVDATSGGTDFIAMYLSEKNGIDSFHVPLIINAVILTAAGFLFGWDKALYSIIFQYATTAVIRVLYRKYQRATLFVVTDKPSEVADLIYKNFNHGATVLEGEGSYEHTEKKVIYSVVSSAESGKVTQMVKEVDPHAFVNVIKTERLLGNFYKRPTD